MKHMREEMPAVRSINPMVPQAMENIVIKATTKNKAYRYKSALDMYDDLMNCLKDKNKDVPKLVFTADTLNDSTIMIDQVANMTPTKPKRKIGFIQALIGISFIALAAMAVYGYVIISGFLNPVATLVTIPNVVEMTRTDAEAALTSLGLSVSKSVKFELTDNIANGLVIKVVPVWASRSKKGPWCL